MEQRIVVITVEMQLKIIQYSSGHDCLYCYTQLAVHLSCSGVARKPLAWLYSITTTTTNFGSEKKPANGTGCECVPEVKGPLCTVNFHKKHTFDIWLRLTYNTIDLIKYHAHAAIFYTHQQTYTIGITLICRIFTYKGVIWDLHIITVNFFRLSQRSAAMQVGRIAMSDKRWAQKSETVSCYWKFFLGEMNNAHVQYC